MLVAEFYIRSFHTNHDVACLILARELKRFSLSVSVGRVCFPLQYFGFVVFEPPPAPQPKEGQYDGEQKGDGYYQDVRLSELAYAKECSYRIGERCHRSYDG